LNSDINIENCKVNSCFRPVTPDGSPIIGRITGFPNIFVNAGHGTKGTTYSLGSATILADIIENGNEAEERWNQYGMSRFYLV
jgi:D-amino-acid dehydrogenase